MKFGSGRRKGIVDFLLLGICTYSGMYLTHTMRSTVVGVCYERPTFLPLILRHIFKGINQSTHHGDWIIGKVIADTSPHLGTRARSFVTHFLFWVSKCQESSISDSIRIPPQHQTFAWSGGMGLAPGTFRGVLSGCFVPRNDAVDQALAKSCGKRARVLPCFLSDFPERSVSFFSCRRWGVLRWQRLESGLLIRWLLPRWEWGAGKYC